MHNQIFVGLGLPGLYGIGAYDPESKRCQMFHKVVHIATPLTYDDIFNDTGLLTRIWKSASIWRSYGSEYIGILLTHGGHWYDFYATMWCHISLHLFLILRYACFCLSDLRRQSNRFGQIQHCKITQISCLNNEHYLIVPLRAIFRRSQAAP